MTWLKTMTVTLRPSLLAVLTLLWLVQAPLAQTADEKLGEMVRAAAAGNIHVVEALLDGGTDPNLADDKGTTALMAAAAWNRTGIAKLLLNKLADVDSQRKDGRTALMIAARGDHAEMISLLVARGANITAEDKSGWRALHYAAKGKKVEPVSVLLEAGASPNAGAGKIAATPMILAAGSMQDKALEILSELLGADGDPNGAAKDGWTPLMAAVRRNGVKRIVLLLDAGAKVNAAAQDGRTALSIAARGGQLPLVQLLLDRGSAPDGAETGETPLTAALRGKSAAIVQLLLKLKVDVNKPGAEGKTPLIISASLGETELVRQLMDAGADVNLQNPQDGTTALMWAANTGAIETVRLLLDSGARADLKAKDGWSAAEAARTAGHEDILKLLARDI